MRNLPRITTDITRVLVDDHQHALLEQARWVRARRRSRRWPRPWG